MYFAVWQSRHATQYAYAIGIYSVEQKHGFYQQSGKRHRNSKFDPNSSPDFKLQLLDA
jgi:hypothetical protein